MEEQKATFSACLGGPFPLVLPYVYAEKLAAKLVHGSALHTWCTPIGWGPYGSLKYTRQIIDAIHDGSLAIVV